MKHFLKKLWRTIKVLSILFMVRTFGQYHHSVHDPSGVEFAEYCWRGSLWLFPSQPKLNDSTPLLSDLAKQAGYKASDWIKDHH